MWLKGMEREERRGGRVGMEAGPGTAVRIIHGSGARCKEQKQKLPAGAEISKHLLRRELLRRCCGEKEEGGVVQCTRTLQTKSAYVRECTCMVVMGGCYGVSGVCTRRSVSACSRDWVGRAHSHPHSCWMSFICIPRHIFARSP